MSAAPSSGSTGGGQVLADGGRVCFWCGFEIVYPVADACVMCGAMCGDELAQKAWVKRRSDEAVQKTERLAWAGFCTELEKERVVHQKALELLGHEDPAWVIVKGRLARTYQRQMWGDRALALKAALLQYVEILDMFPDHGVLLEVGVACAELEEQEWWEGEREGFVDVGDDVLQEPKFEMFKERLVDGKFLGAAKEVVQLLGEKVSCELAVCADMWEDRAMCEPTTARDVFWAGVWKYHEFTKRKEENERRALFEKSRSYFLRALDMVDEVDGDAALYVKIKHALGKLYKDFGEGGSANEAFQHADVRLERARSEVDCEVGHQALAHHFVRVYEDVVLLNVELDELEHAFEWMERCRARQLLDGDFSMHSFEETCGTVLREDLCVVEFFFAQKTLLVFIINGGQIVVQKRAECFLRLRGLVEDFESGYVSKPASGGEIDYALYAQLPEFPGAQLPESPDEQLPEFPDAQVPELPDEQLPEFPGAQLPEFPGEQLSQPRLPGAQFETVVHHMASELDIDDIVKNIPPSVKELVVVPHRVLHRVPFGALPVNGGECLLDRFELGVRSAPSCQLLCLINKRAPAAVEVNALTSLACDARRNGRSPLKYHIIEAAMMRALWLTQGGGDSDRSSPVSAVDEEHATTDAVRKLTSARSPRCLHFSGHGRFYWCATERPTGLELHGDMLTVRDMRGLPLHNCEVALLMACNSGAVDVASDTDMGIAGAAIVAGAQSVVSTLCDVRDPSSCVLSMRFSENWISHGMPPKVALREAQLWMRGVERTELGEWLDKMEGLIRQAGCWSQTMWERFGELRASLKNAPGLLSNVRHWGSVVLIGGV